MSGLLSKHQAAADERAFLPAAVEVLETPASPLKHYLTLGICLLFIAILLWAWIGKIDVVVEAQGRVIPDRHVKTISAIQVARVQTLFVHEGSYVKRGDVLAELAPNPTDLESTTDQPMQEIMTHQLNILRLNALLANSVEVKPLNSKDVLLDLQKVALKKNDWFSTPPSLQRWEIESEALISELNNYWSADQSMLKRTEELKALLAADKAELKKLALLRSIHDKQESAARTLFNKKMISELEWLARREKQIETQQQESVMLQHHIEHQARLHSAVAERVQRKEEFLLRIHKERLYSIQQLDHSTATLKKARQREHNQFLRAPVSGIVQQLQVRSEGDVVQPAQPIMVIVPENNPLEAEVMIENKDIHWIMTNQKVNIKVDTYPYTRYGHLKGSIRHIAPDAISDEQKGWVFPARVALSDSHELINSSIQVQPGLSVTVDVIVGKRRLLEFFMSPLLRHTKESFRETM